MAKNATIMTDSKWYDGNIIAIDELQSHESSAIRSSRFKPIPHSEILTAFRQKAQDYGLVLTEETGRLKKDGMRYMYSALIADKHDAQHEYGLTVGFVSHNDGTKSFTGLLGSKVFMCCNMTYHGVVHPATMRHTTHNYDLIGNKIDVVLTKFIEQRPMIFGQMKLLKETKLNDALLGQFILNLTRTKRFGNTKVLDVVRYIDDPTAMIVSELETPTLNKKSDDSAFRLLNACTYITTHKIENEAVKHELSKVMLDTLMTTIQGKDYQPIGDAIEVQAEAVAA